MPTRELVSRDRHRLVLGAGSVEYTLVRRRGRRGVGLKVDETGLTVSAPSTMPHSRVESLVRESERWVLRKIAEWSTRQVPAVTWHDGSPIPYLGGTLVLRLSQGSRGSAELAGEELRATVRSFEEAEVRRVVVGWYKRAALAYLAERLRVLSIAAVLAPPRLMLSSAMARWGSCNTRREVRLAWRLVKAPPELVDYVICHELAHLRHMNHSPAFWAEVARQCPDYRRLRDELFATDHLYRAF
jgi:predicted metal-dependent hydrolase